MMTRVVTSQGNDFEDDLDDVVYAVDYYVEDDVDGDVCLRREVATSGEGV